MARPLLFLLLRPEDKMLYFPVIALVISAFCVNAQQVTPLAVLKDPEVPGVKLRLTNASFSHDGAQIVTSSEYGLTRVWDARNFQSKLTCRQQDVITPEHQRKGLKKVNQPWVRDAEFSPDGQQVVMAGPYGNVWIWNLALGDCKNQNMVFFNGHTDDARTAEFSPDGQRLVTTSDDTTVRIWSVTGELLKTFTVESSNYPKAFTTSARFSPDGKIIVVTRSDGFMAKIDVATYEMTELRSGTTNNMALWQASFHPNNETFVTASEDGEVALWNFAGEKLKSLRASSSHGANSVAFSPDGRVVAVGVAAKKETDEDSSAVLIRVEDGQVLAEIPGSKESISKVSFSSDGSYLLVSSYNGEATILRLRGL